MQLRGGRYETIDKIASGGMAKVLLGRTVGVGGFERLVAIKAMHEHLSSEPEFVAMFLDEARLAARIHHPNVVSTLDVDEDEEGVFIVMEYVEGPALSAIQRAVRQHGTRIPFDVTLRIFLDTLAGLHAAHELRDANDRPLHLVHRDVSPQNILVGVDGVSRLTDFGVARAESRLGGTSAGQIKGKLAFMAPEQLSSQVVDRRADVYAAGVVLWEMLTSQRLLPGDNDIATITQILNGRRRSPREVDPSIPLELEAVCMRALEPRPEHRFPSAAAFAEAIETAREPICSPRGVAAFVMQVNVHQRPPALPAAAPSSGRASRTGVSLPERSEGSRPGRAGPSMQPTAASASFSAPPGRGRFVITAVAAVTALMAVSWFALRERGSGPAATSAVVPPPASAVNAVAQAPSAPVTTAVAPSASAPSAPSVAREVVAAVVDAKPRAHGSPTATAKPSATPTPNLPPPSSTSFRPGEL